MNTPLGTIEEEGAACWAAWAANPAKWGWHIHHDTLCEERAYPIEERITYILTQKPKAERALRLRLMRPAPTMAPIEKTYADAMPAQTRAMLDLLRARGPEGVSALDALRVIGCYRPAARVWQLKRAGYVITTTRKRGQTAVYVLEPAA